MARIAGTFWDGIALRRTHAAADPDAAPRALALPAAWDEPADDDRAAAALAALAPGHGPASLPGIAERWIGRVVAQGTQLGLLTPDETLSESLRTLLIARRGAPGASTWRGDAKAEPRFVLNLPAFLDATGGFDSAGYAAAAGTGLQALEILTGGKATRLRLGFADLAGLLAGLGLAYDSKEARAVATCLSALTRGAAECASAALADRLGARGPAALLWPTPPDCVVPGLAAAARRALDEAGATHGLRHAGCFALTAADAAEALLGAETGGLAPASGATRLAHDDFGRVVEVPTRAAHRAGPRAAVLLAPVSEAAREAMEAAIRPHLHAATPVAPARPQPARLVLQTRPQPRAAATARGSIYRVVVGGHRVTLRTTEAPDGSLAEIALGMSKEGAAFRGLLDGFLQSVNIGLARGVPLSDYVTAFAYTRFGPAGLVEGDAGILCATSVFDWAFRRLAIAHMGEASRQVWPDPSEEDCAADAIGTPTTARDAPLLPLDLPAQPSPAARRRSFRLVG